LGRLGRDLGALSAYYGYVRNPIFGLNVKPIDTSNTMKANVTVDPYTEVDFDVIIETFLYHLLSIALTERWVFLMFIHLLLQRI
jgi:hypothetical protein